MPKRNKNLQNKKNIIFQSKEVLNSDEIEKKFNALPLPFIYWNIQFEFSVPSKMSTPNDTQRWISKLIFLGLFASVYASSIQSNNESNNTLALESLNINASSNIPTALPTTEAHFDYSTDFPNNIPADKDVILFFKGMEYIDIEKDVLTLGGVAKKDITPQHKQAIAAVKNLYQLFQNQDYKTGLEKLSQLKKTMPTNIFFQATEALFLEKIKKTKEAETMFTTLAEKEKRNHSIQFMTARFYLRELKYQKAFEYIKIAIELFPENTNYANFKDFVNFQLEKKHTVDYQAKLTPKQVLQQPLQIVPQAPDFIQVFNSIEKLKPFYTGFGLSQNKAEEYFSNLSAAEGHFRNGNFEEGISICSKLASELKDFNNDAFFYQMFSAIYFQWGHALRASGKKEAALEKYNIAVGISWKSSPYLYEYGNLLEELNEIQLAFLAHAQALQGLSRFVNIETNTNLSDSNPYNPQRYNDKFVDSLEKVLKTQDLKIDSSILIDIYRDSLKRIEIFLQKDNKAVAYEFFYTASKLLTIKKVKNKLNEAEEQQKLDNFEHRIFPDCKAEDTSNTNQHYNFSDKLILGLIVVVNLWSVISIFSLFSLIYGRTIKQKTEYLSDLENYFRNNFAFKTLTTIKNYTLILTLKGGSFSYTYNNISRSVSYEAHELQSLFYNNMQKFGIKKLGDNQIIIDGNSSISTDDLEETNSQVAEELFKSRASIYQKKDLRELNIILENMINDFTKTKELVLKVNGDFSDYLKTIISKPGDSQENSKHPIIEKKYKAYANCKKNFELKAADIMEKSATIIESIDGLKDNLSKLMKELKLDNMSNSQIELEKIIKSESVLGINKFIQEASAYLNEKKSNIFALKQEYLKAKQHSQEANNNNNDQENRPNFNNFGIANMRGNPQQNINNNRPNNANNNVRRAFGPVNR